MYLPPCWVAPYQHPQKWPMPLHPRSEALLYNTAFVTSGRIITPISIYGGSTLVNSIEFKNYRLIHKSLWDFRPLRYSSRDGHDGGEHVNRGRDTPSFCGSVWYMVQNLRCTVRIDLVLANCKTQNAFLSPVHAMFRHNCPLAVKLASTPRRLLPKKTWRDSLLIDMLLFAVSVLVVALPSS
jgi:hypothetical protein